MEDAKKKIRKWPRVLRGIFLGIVIALILFNLVYVAYCSFFVKPGEIPEIAGYGIATDTLQRMDPDVPKGSVLIVQSNPSGYAAGNIVVYASDDRSSVLVGRISEISDEAVGSGYIIETNQGTAERITTDRLRGRVTHKILYFGYYLDFIMTVNGAAFCIILPCALIIAYQLVRILLYAWRSRRDVANVATSVSEREDREVFPEIPFVPKAANANMQPDRTGTEIPLQFGGIPILGGEEKELTGDPVKQVKESASPQPASVVPEQPSVMPQDPSAISQQPQPKSVQSQTTQRPSVVPQQVPTPAQPPAVPQQFSAEEQLPIAAERSEPLQPSVAKAPVSNMPLEPKAPKENVADAAAERSSATEKDDPLQKALNGSRIPSDILELLHSLEDSDTTDKI